MILNTFPGQEVQLEGDYFTLNGVSADWEVDHCGCSDYNRSYWPLTWQIAMTENEPLATQLFSVSERFIIDSDGHVRKVLVDGGKALQAAVNNLANSQTAKVEPW